MSAAPTMSVIVITHNYGHFLARAINSVLNQTCPVLEIIVVDDGSTDNTREVVAGFGDRIRYVYQENAGAAAARNTGIKIARGEWIGYLDSDDWWFPEKNQRVMELLQKHPDAVFIYHPSVLLFDDGREGVKETLDADALWPTLRYRNLISGGSCVLVRRSAQMEIGDFDKTYASIADWDMWVRVAVRYPLHKIPETLTWQWMHGDSLGSNHARNMGEFRRLSRTTLIAGLHGLNRLFWRQRILASLLWDTSLDVRRTHPAASRGYLFESLMVWPSPFFFPKRWWALILTLTGRL